MKDTGSLKWILLNNLVTLIIIIVLGTFAQKYIEGKFKKTLNFNSLKRDFTDRDPTSFWFLHIKQFGQT